MNRLFLNTLFLLLLIPGFVLAQEDKKEAEPEKKEEQKEEEKPKYIIDIITEKAVSDTGLFNLHQVDSKLYFEIPEQHLNTDMLLVTRIAKIPSNLSPYINAGSKTGEQVVNWEKKDNKVLLKVKSYQNVSDEEDPINISVSDNNFEPIIASFKIEATNPDSNHYLVDVSSLFSKDIKALSGLNSSLRTIYKVRSMDKDQRLVFDTMMLSGKTIFLFLFLFLFYQCFSYFYVLLV